MTDLEFFRADLFTKTQDLPEQPEEQPNEALDQTKDSCISDSVTCGWCGTRLPLPNYKFYSKVLETDANIEAAKEISVQDFVEPGAVFLGHPGAGDCKPDVDSGDFESNIHICQYDFADVFSPLLCEVVATLEGDHGRELKCLRKQSVSAYRARLQHGGKPFPGFSWLACDAVPEPQTRMKRYSFKKQHSPVSRYSTDGSTGECKVQ